MTYEDKEARSLTKHSPGKDQAWLYELKASQKPTSVQIRGCAPDTTSPRHILGYADEVDQKIVRLYIPRYLIRRTLENLRSLPLFSYICDEDLENVPEVSRVAKPGESFIFDIGIKDLLIPISQEVATTYMPLLRPFGTRAPGEDGLSMCISYWLNVICAAGSDFHQAVLGWALERKHAISEATHYASVLHNGTPIPKTTPLDEVESFRDTYIALALGFKRGNEAHISAWVKSRVGAMLAKLGVSTTLNVGALRFSTALSTFLRSQTSLLSRLIDVILANRNNPSNPMLASLCDGVVPIAEYSGMKTAQSACEFYNKCESGAMLLGIIFEEGDALTKAWEELQAWHGERFPFARALNLAGVERLNIRNFPNLAYCTWFSKNSDPAYKYMAAHRPTVDIQLLQAYTKTPLKPTKVQSTSPTWAAR